MDPHRASVTNKTIMITTVTTLRMHHDGRDKKPGSECVSVVFIFGFDFGLPWSPLGRSGFRRTSLAIQIHQHRHGRYHRGEGSERWRINAKDCTWHEGVDVLGEEVVQTVLLLRHRTELAQLRKLALPRKVAGIVSVAIINHVDSTAG